MRRVLLVSLLVIAANLSFAAASAGPAVAKPTMTFQIGLTSKLIARGAAVQTRLAYACSVATPAPSVFVTVTEAVTGGRAAQGNGSPDVLRCDGKRHVLLLSTSAANGVAFRKGVAFAQGGIVSCDAVCTVVSVSRTVNVT